MISIALPTFVFTTIITSLALVVIMLRQWLLPQREVQIRVSDHKSFTAFSGYTLLSALQGSGFMLPAACGGAGTCGLCKVTLLHNAPSPQATERAILEPAETDIGVRLSCQLRLSDDLVVEIPDSVSQAAEWQCKVESTRHLSPLIKEIVLAFPPDGDFSFSAGEYVEVTAPAYRLALSDLIVDKQFESQWMRLDVGELVASTQKPTSRAYSIASTPADNKKIVLLIRLALPPPGRDRSLPPGIVSSWLFSQTAGDSVSIRGPYGDFKLRDSDNEVVLIGGGVGMAPLRAMAHTLAGGHRSTHLYYGARSLTDLFYHQEFNQLAATHKNFTWTVALSDPECRDDWSGAIGFIHDIVQNRHIKTHRDPSRCDYYLCGPPLMLQATTAMLHQAGIPDTQIFFDNFGS